MTRKVEISHKTVVFTFLFVIFLWFLYFIRDILLQLFVALLLMTILQPLVNKIASLKVPRALAVAMSYVIIIGIFIGVIALVIPPLAEQTTSFVTVLPQYLNNLGLSPFINTDISGQILSRLGNIPSEVLKLSVSIISNFASVLTVLVFSFYMLLTRDRLEDHLGFLFGEEKRRELGKLIDTLEKGLGGWARGQFALMFMVGLSTFIGLTILGIPFALPLALLAGLLEIIPYLGPVLAAIPSIIIGFGISPVSGLGVSILAVLIQQLENYVFVPKIMQKSVGVSPIVTLVALAIGARLAGVVGMIISIPSVITIQSIFKHYIYKD